MEGFDEYDMCPENESQSHIPVEDVLHLRHLQELMNIFRAHRPRTPNRFRNISKIENKERGKMDVDEFKATMATVLETHVYDGQLDNLFNKLDISHDNFVDWNEFTTYVLQQLKEKDFLNARKFRPFRGDPRIRHIVHNREGAASVWTTGLTLETHFEVCEDPTIGRNQKRRVKMWVNDAVYLPNCRKLAVVTTGRDIHFHETTSGQYNKDFTLYGLEDVPNCVDYWYDRQSPSSASRLYAGDDEGNIHIYTFNQPNMSLFNPRKKQAGTQRIYFPDLRLHSSYVEHNVLVGIHRDLIKQVHYVPESGYIISLSSSLHQSIVITDELGKKRSYTFNITKGAECFAFSKPLNLLVTGSSDHKVRVWNPYVTARAVATLSGHAVGVIDIKIHEKLRIIISYSKDAVVKVWDPSEQTCLQTVTLKFPCAIHGPLLEHGPFSIFLSNSSTGVLLVTAQDYFASLRLSTFGPDTTESTSHQAQLCAAIYNPYFKQVVTAADDSTIGVWDLETGRKAMMLTECHGHEEITCICFDTKYQRLISGARDGTIKIWNVQTGQSIQQLETGAEAEVTGIVPLTDRPVILSVGWSRQIVMYDDTNPENAVVRGDPSWPGGQLHNDDVLCSAYLPPTLLATGSYDGVICVWSMEKGKLLAQLRTIARRQSSPDPADALLFLASRDRLTECATLVSSSGGYLGWWNVYTQKLLGFYYVPNEPDESVLAVCSDGENQILIAGDTKGYLSIWNISSFCTSTHSEALDAKPPVVESWLAHEGAIASVEHIVYDPSNCFNIILTASTDRLVKLWTMNATCIGTFGQISTMQTQSWNLRSLSTETSCEKTGNVKKRNLSDDHLTDSHDNTDFTVLIGAAPKSASFARGELLCDGKQNRLDASINHGRQQTTLGHRVEQEFERRRIFRQKRRAETAGSISGMMDSSCVKGLQLSLPFHALNVKPLDDFLLPDHITPSYLKPLATSSQKSILKPLAKPDAHARTQAVDEVFPQSASARIQRPDIVQTSVEAEDPRRDEAISEGNFSTHFGDKGPIYRKS